MRATSPRQHAVGQRGMGRQAAGEGGASDFPAQQRRVETCQASVLASKSHFVRYVCMSVRMHVKHLRSSK